LPLSIAIPKLRPGCATTNTPSSKILYDEIKTLGKSSSMIRWLFIDKLQLVLIPYISFLYCIP
jgi:hypothetical protein